MYIIVWANCPGLKIVYVDASDPVENPGFELTFTSSPDSKPENKPSLYSPLYESKFVGFKVTPSSLTKNLTW